MVHCTQFWQRNIDIVQASRFLQVGVDKEGEEDSLLLIWPTTVVHIIDSDSPFYHMSAKDFYRKHYEIIVVLEGIVEPTGKFTYMHLC